MKSRLIGWSFILITLYCTIGAFVYFTSLLTLQHGKQLNFPWITSAQKSLYRAGMVSVSSWLSTTGCITPDPDLIYKPSTGTCHFSDIEFDITLSFNDEGRYTGQKPIGVGIAVIGDSHAMGWGVNDLETFSARLQSLSNRPVYNLGVASYGTARELIRLEKSGVLNKVDTVIIQYCNNDKAENIKFDSTSKDLLREQVFSPEKTPMRADGLVFIIRGYLLTLKAPFSSLAERMRRKDFAPHYAALTPIFEKHRATLANKKIIVFYSNPYGQIYRNFPHGIDKQFSTIHFVDLGLDHLDHRKLDNHLTPAGHQKVAVKLWDFLRSL